MFKDLYFGITHLDLNSGKLVSDNVFDFMRVRRSICTYILYKDKDLQITDPLSYCFGDLRGRYEWEMYISGHSESDEPTKHDVYEMYIEPNREYLMKLVNSISEKEAKKWKKENQL